MKIIKAPKPVKGWGQVQIGTSSLVLIFTVLSLVVFSTLSLASARVDENLAQKTKQYVTDYYKGDGIAEERLREINEYLNEIEKQTFNESEYIGKVAKKYPEIFDENKKKITYTVDISNEQYIKVELDIASYEIAIVDNKNYKIRSWTVNNRIDYEIDDSMPVWDGEPLLNN